MFFALLLITLNPAGAAAGTIVLTALAGLVIARRLRKLPMLIRSAVADAARQYGLLVAEDRAQP